MEASSCFKADCNHDLYQLPIFEYPHDANYVCAEITSVFSFAPVTAPDVS